MSTRESLPNPAYSGMPTRIEVPGREAVEWVIAGHFQATEHGM